MDGDSSWEHTASIIAAKATAAGGKVSRIVPKLEGPVTTPRIDTRYVVTEFGAVNLKGLSSTERVHALVGLAHPDFLDELMQAADRPRSDTDLINCRPWSATKCQATGIASLSRRVRRKSSSQLTQRWRK